MVEVAVLSAAFCDIALATGLRRRRIKRIVRRPGKTMVLFKQADQS
jgi:hypothetical protein